MIKTFICVLSMVFGTFPLLRAQTGDMESCGQYLVCGARKANYQHARLASNILTGIADTTVCFIVGHVTDFKSQDVPFAKMVFTNKKSKKVYWCSTDMHGDFKATLPAGSYTMQSFYPFYDSLAEQMTFGTGDMRKLEISIGENYCLQTKLTSDRKVLDSLKTLEPGMD